MFICLGFLEGILLMILSFSIALVLLSYISQISNDTEQADALKISLTQTVSILFSL